MWYHVLRGSKVFVAAPPTAHNLALYERWSRSPSQVEVFLGSLLEKGQRVELSEGHTLLLPSGMHAYVALVMCR